jgi:hypothetical protein
MYDNSSSSRLLDSTIDESSNDSVHHQHIIGSYIFLGHVANIHTSRVTDDYNNPWAQV